MKGKKKIITVALILLIAIGLITTGISAANLIGADSVQYKDTTVKAALDELIDKASACKDMSLSSKVRIGDYVSMTPTSYSYTVSNSLTGYGNQTIKPSELKLWRVIAINDDGTIDMVSHYLSSTTVGFSDQKGYLNLVGGLNTIAKQYENSEFTVGSRHMGYNGQTEYITDTSKFTNPAPWTTSTSDNSNEALGGGDILYEKDYDLVRNAIGTLTGYPYGNSSSAEYWLASRYYDYSDSSTYSYCSRSVVNSALSWKCGNNSLYYYGSGLGGLGWKAGSNPKYIRPIVTLKASVQAAGSGTSDDPWVLF